MFTIDAFFGPIPKLSSQKVPEQVAQEAVNCKLGSGSLRALSRDLPIKRLDATPATIHLYDKDGTDIWLTSTKDVDIVKGPIADDTKNRVYISGLDAHLRVSDSDSLTEGELTTGDTFIAGLPIPSSAPATSASGGVSPETEDITYVYTLVREWGDGKVDEGPPSPASDILTVKLDDTVSVTGINSPSSPGDYGIAKKYIYRSQTNSDGVAYFYWVGEIDESETTFSDDLGTNDIGEMLESDEWFAPPDNLKGIIALPNGSLAGFVGTRLYASEPFQPHAWPPGNSQTVDFDIVGLGKIGNYITILTRGTPSIVNASDPAAMAYTGLDSMYPCLSRDGIVSTGLNVFYPSADGLIVMSTSGATNFTADIMTRAEWAKFAPETIKATIFNEQYIAFYEKTYPANTVAEYEKTVQAGFYIPLDASNKCIPSLDFYATSLFLDKDTSRLFFARVFSGVPYIYEWEGDVWNKKSYRWKSKVLTSRSGPVNLAVGRVLAETYLSSLTYDELLEQYRMSAQWLAVNDETFQNAINESRALGAFVFNPNTPLGGDIRTVLGGSYSGQEGIVLKIYADGVLKFVKNVQNDRVFKLPSGFKANLWEVQVEGVRDVYRVDLATEAKEIPS